MPPVNHDRLQEFVTFCQTYILSQPAATERSNSGPFLEAFFQAFGYAGTKQAGATIEQVVDQGSRKGQTGYADLYWPDGSLLIELKRRSERHLDRHYNQAWGYAQRLTPQPQYIILCNFEQFWIYDLTQSVSIPVERLALDELPFHPEAFRFMERGAAKPKFRDGQIVEVTATAAQRMGLLYRSLCDRRDRLKKPPYTEADAQRFVLQCVLAMFAQGRGLLPPNRFSDCLDRCLPQNSDDPGESTYDILCEGLFRQMNRQGKTPYGRFQGTDYFNGGLFAQIPAIHLERDELKLLKVAADQNWTKVQPAIFGNIFEQTTTDRDRHAGGMHFTSENDIMKIIRPSIVQPWEQAIEQAHDLKQLNQLHLELSRYRVLDPACGSGNFLYIAYQELKQVEQVLLDKIAALEKTGLRRLSLITPLQFFGMDINPFAVELARVTLMIARKVAIDRLGLNEPALPLDTLDQNIRKQDALMLETWPAAEVIVGNPPFQSKNKMQQELGAAYVKTLRDRYPEIPGRADYCVYWLRRSHDHLKPGQRAGLVGTNTIRQNYSREGGLDYIVQNGGTITHAVSSQVWSGAAAVHVSIVNWIKGEWTGQKTLITQLGDRLDSPWRTEHPAQIHAALSSEFDVTQAVVIQANARSQACYQGQTHGHEGFFIDRQQAKLSAKELAYIYPYLNGNDLLGYRDLLSLRSIIDLNHCQSLDQVKSYPGLLKHIKQTVYPAIKQLAEDEFAKTKKATGPRQSHLQKWWKYWRSRDEMIHKISALNRYIVASRVTKRPIFTFISSTIRPSDALQVFALDDDYSFGVLQSSLHWQWFTRQCSTLKGDFRYTSNTVFDTFPWPQTVTIAQITAVAEAARSLRQLRETLMAEAQWSLRDLYKTLDQPGDTPLHQTHAALDRAVAAAYGWDDRTDPLAFLFQLNQAVAAAERSGEPVVGPGLPPGVGDRSAWVSTDCIRTVSVG
ncbi:MAG: class I SAM-dependent DNA methyltransferase [Limnothrix sp. CACIAM 69d]|nr:MAG: class I SAM-dependent DNA methyltransferase [Limnothrix sp. CACIAM 69d]